MSNFLEVCTIAGGSNIFGGLFYAPMTLSADLGKIYLLTILVNPFTYSEYFPVSYLIAIKIVVSG